MKRKQKKTYRKPEIKSEQIFERTALGCSDATNFANQSNTKSHGACSVSYS